MKKLLLIASICMLGAGVVNAVNLYSYRDGPRYWDVTGSWTDNAVSPWNGPAVAATPGASDNAYIAHSMSITNDAECLALQTGYKATGALTITASGTLTTASITQGVKVNKDSTINNYGTITLSGGFSHSRAIATVNNSGTMTIGGNLSFATHSADAEEMDFTNTGTINVTGFFDLGLYTNSTFNMSGGTVTASELRMNSSSSVTHINLNGGTIDVTTVTVNTNSPSIYTKHTIDVTDGVLIADGDNREEWDFLIDEGVFTAEGGSGGIAAQYDSGTDETTLTKMPLGTTVSIH